MGVCHRRPHRCCSWFRGCSSETRTLIHQVTSIDRQRYAGHVRPEPDTRYSTASVIYDLESRRPGDVFQVTGSTYPISVTAAHLITIAVGGHDVSAFARPVLAISSHTAALWSGNPSTPRIISSAATELPLTSAIANFARPVTPTRRKRSSPLPHTPQVHPDCARQMWTSMADPAPMSHTRSCASVG